jgi:hypothetical protein
MRPPNRFIATLLAVIVWGAAGYAVASGPLAYRDATPGTPGLVAYCFTLLGN